MMSIVVIGSIIGKLSVENQDGKWKAKNKRSPIHSKMGVDYLKSFGGVDIIVGPKLKIGLLLNGESFRQVLVT